MERDVERDAAEWEHLSQAGLRNLEVVLLPDTGEALPVVDPINPMEDCDWRLDDDDLLGEDLVDDLRNQAPPSNIAAPVPEKESLMPPKQSPIAADEEAVTEKEASLLLGLKEFTAKPEKKEPKKKEAHKREAHARRGQKSPSLLINSASRKIQTVKGRSPAKRLASKTGPTKQRGSRGTKKSVDVPPSEVFPSSSSMAINSNDILAGLPPPENIE